MSFATLMASSSTETRDALMRHGALHIVDCPDRSSTARFVARMGWSPFRSTTHLEYAEDEAIGEGALPLHHDIGQGHRRPGHLLFFCARPANSGGEIVLVDSRDVATLAEKLSPDVCRRLESGVTYERVLPAVDDPSSPIGGSWRSTFLCGTKDEVEAKLQRSRMEWAWRTNASLWVRSSPTSAFDTAGGRRVFSNSILSVVRGWNDARNRGSECVRFADGEAIPAEFVESLYAAAWKTRYECDLQAGELLVVDNARTMHGRRPFSGARDVAKALLN